MVTDALDELYGLPPSEFVAARDALAAETRKAGEREQAASIKKLRRPSASAWLANLLARHRREQLDQLLGLGEALRDAQSQLAAGDLRRLSQQRHTVVQALGAEAARLAEEAGHPVSDAVRQELEGTLEAALADPDAAGAVRAGRLTGALSYAGLGPGTTGVPAPPPARPGRHTAPPSPASARKEALAEAQAAVTAAEEQARAQAARVQAAQDAWERAGRQLDELERQLVDLRAERDRLGEDLTAATSARDDAEREATAAREALERLGGED